MPLPHDPLSWIPKNVPMDGSPNPGTALLPDVIAGFHGHQNIPLGEILANLQAVDLRPYEAAADPTVTDDSSAGYKKGSLWKNTSTNGVFMCTDATVGAAVWYGLSVILKIPGVPGNTPLYPQGFIILAIDTPEFNPPSTILWVRMSSGVVNANWRQLFKGAVSVSAPTVDDDRSKFYSRGDIWVMDDSSEIRVCEGNVVGAAKWTPHSSRYSNYAEFQEKAPLGVAGMVIPGGAYVTRQLNQKFYDEAGFVLEFDAINHKFRLKPGVYEVEAFATVTGGPGANKILLKDMTTTVVDAWGQNLDGNGVAVLSGQFVITSGLNYHCLYHWCTAGASGGAAVNLPPDLERYATVKLWRVRCDI